jgi:hypothetical protein
MPSGPRRRRLPHRDRGQRRPDDLDPGPHPGTGRLPRRAELRRLARAPARPGTSPRPGPPRPRPRREQRNYTIRARRRGTGPRHRAAPHGGAPPASTKLTLTGHVLAVRQRDHLHLTSDLTGALPGVDRTTISHATSLTRQLLAGTGIPLPPAPDPATRLRTPDDLRHHAQAAGITLTIPPARPNTPKYTRRKQPQPHDTPEKNN